MGLQVYYGIFSRKTARLLRSYESQDEAVAAVRSALRAEPRAEGLLALMQFDEDGREMQVWSGSELRAFLAESELHLAGLPQETSSASLPTRRARRARSPRR
jgi:hypothetical protein